MPDLPTERPDRPTTGLAGFEHRRWELITTILMASATLLTAWAAFQASKWSGEMSLGLSRAAAVRVESAKADADASQQLLADQSLFTEWLRGTATGDSTYARYYEERFGEDLALAFDQWQSQQPPVNGRTPASPFETEAYQTAGQARSEELVAEAEALVQEAVDDNQRSDNYTLLTVLFATVILFAGMAGQADSRNVRRLTAGLAVTAITVGGALLVAFPKAF